jgi:hypothetical protein
MELDYGLDAVAARRVAPSPIGQAAGMKVGIDRVLQLLIERRQKKIAGKLAIAPVSSTIAATRSLPVLVRTAAGQKLMFADGSGAFRIDLGNGEILHAIRCKLNPKLVREYLAGPEKAIRALYLLLESGRKRARTKLARCGLWRTFEWNDQIAYAGFVNVVGPDEDLTDDHSHHSHH